MTEYTRICKACNIEFVTTDHRRVFHSDECSKIGTQQRSAKFRKEHPDIVYERRTDHKIKYRDRRYSLDGYVTVSFNRIKNITKDTDLTKEFLKDLIIKNKECCSVSKIPFRYKNTVGSSKNPYSPSVDRIDSDKGYYKDNIQIILTSLNHMKSNMPNNDFLKLLDEIKGVNNG